MISNLIPLSAQQFFTSRCNKLLQLRQLVDEESIAYVFHGFSHDSSFYLRIQFFDILTCFERLDKCQLLRFHRLNSPSETKVLIYGSKLADLVTDKGTINISLDRRRSLVK